MFEVEAKIPIGKREFERLRKKLQAELGSGTLKNTEDIYFDNPKMAYIRLRRRGGESSFDIKKRATRKGIESNIEMEFKLKDANTWKGMLRKWGIRPCTRKWKRSLQFKKKDFIIELNHVRLLGYYLEIERIVASEKWLPKAKKELIKMFKDLGFKPADFEPRPYLELLSHV